MTLLLSVADLPARRAAAAGPIAPLAKSLRADLTRLADAAEIWYPEQKARLTRIGGRCPRHGVLLAFDPWSPRAHRCAACAEPYVEEEHHQWWIMNYQLWLAERSVHAAALAVLTGDRSCRALAERILDGYAARYLNYPNRDNVLGPTRPFFSTYLESIWLLQLAVTTSLLELETPLGSLGERVRERVLSPSAALIAQYHEGDSNRQAWNAAALAAAYRLLGMTGAFEQVLCGSDGVCGLIDRGLLADGTWYEGENYHLFAHRGLWYGVQMAAVAGLGLPARATARFTDAFLTPFLTALPDFTFPARRDSQYHVSLRQWRMAESCELAVAAGDPRLLGPLATLYADDLEPGDTGRATSTAEAERNGPPRRLDRSSLGWKSLLRALPDLPSAPGWQPRSVNLAAQGFSVFRRHRGRVYVALDYGASGGGHGHPDRLNLWFVHGASRYLEDVGTGSYVDPSLFWYRSTLAHNAPLLDGTSQPWRDGRLVAYDERENGQRGWVVAEFPVASRQGVLRRRVIVMDDYFIDRLEWEDLGAHSIDLPVHVDPESLPAHTQTTARPPAEFSAQVGSGTEFVTEAESIAGGLDTLEVAGDGHRARIWSHGSEPHAWWRLRAPGPPAYPATTSPASASRRFLVCRVPAGAANGCLTSVWCWSGTVARASFGDAIEVVRNDGTTDRHRLVDGRWEVECANGAGVTLDGRVSATDVDRQPRPAAESDDWLAPAGRRVHLSEGREATIELGESHYRRTEESWEEAGSPSATVRVSYASGRVHVVADVRKTNLFFAPARTSNPLDNEHPDINSDGLQLYLSVPAQRFFGSWLLVPELPGPRVRVTPRAGDADRMPIEARWTETTRGYRAQVSLDMVRGAPTVPATGGDLFLLDVAINEMPLGRERRRGQLILSGGRGEWLYLRGDREDPKRMMAFALPIDE